MCLRTLLRQLLAGSGWIVKAGIRKDDAFVLIRMLIGQKIESKVQIELPVTEAPHLPNGWKEHHYTHLLAGLFSLSKNLMADVPLQISFLCIAKRE